MQRARILPRPLLQLMPKVPRQKQLIVRLIVRDIILKLLARIHMQKAAVLVQLVLHRMQKETALHIMELIITL